MAGDAGWIIPYVKAGAVAGAFFVMVFGLCKIFKRLEAKEQGVGPNTSKTIGVVLISSAYELAVVTDINTGALATLLGTVAGYVLSTPNLPGITKHRSPPRAENTGIPSDLAYFRSQVSSLGTLSGGSASKVAQFPNSVVR